MSQLREQMIEDLERAGYAAGTRQQYVNYVRQLAEHFGRSPARLSRAELRGYVTQLHRKREQQRLSDSWLRLRLASMKFVYAKTLGRPDDVSFISWPKAITKVSTVLSPSEVQAVLKALVHPKYRALATTLYATGMRIGEARGLETGDIDAPRGVIVVRKGKGGEGRLVPLTPALLRTLRRYWNQERPEAPLLFRASRGSGAVCIRTVREALHHAAAEAGIQKKVTPHVLRHSFATHQLDLGTDIRVIQHILGHKSVHTTVRYTQVSLELLQRAAPLLERLPR